MKKIMNFLFLSCLKATELIEKSFYFKLSTKERIQLKLHKMMCEPCTKYEKQSMLIEKRISNIENNDFEEHDIEALKQMISMKIDSQNKK